MAAPRFSTQWLVSPRYDLGFFILSAVVTFAFWGLWAALGSDAQPSGTSLLVVYFVFTAFFDHPHIVQTFSRTHRDPIEFRRNTFTHTLGLSAFIIGGFVIAAHGWEAQLVVVAALYGSWHIVRQHWGFVRVYKAKNDDFEPIDNVLDAVTFYAGMAAMLVHDYTDNDLFTPIYGDFRASFPSVPAWVGELAWGLFVVGGSLWLARQAWRWAVGKPLNLPKILLMTAALGTHSFVFFFTATPFLVAEALETAYHDIQYQGWVMHYQRRRFGARVVVRWAAFALFYGLVVGAIEVLALMHRGTSWVFVPFAMIVIYHYYVDGTIWRMRSAPELRAAVL